MKSYVLGFMFSKDKSSVAVIRKQSPTWQAGFLNGIGGKIEKPESPAWAITREFMEETGVVTSVDEWQLKFNMYSEDTSNTKYNEGTDFRVYCYCMFSDKVYNVRTVEQEEVLVLDVNNFPYNEAIDNLSWIIPFMLEDRKYNVEVYKQHVHCS